MADIPVAIVPPVPPLPQGFINPERAGSVRLTPAQAALLYVPCSCQNKLKIWTVELEICFSEI